MTDKPSDTPKNIFDDPLQEQWHLNCDDESAARRALHAARAQLTLKN